MWWDNRQDRRPGKRSRSDPQREHLGFKRLPNRDASADVPASNPVQTQGKIERRHQTLKGHILLEIYFLPSDLECQIGTFVEYYDMSCCRFWGHRGKVYLKLESRHDEAITAARKAVEFNPNHATNRALLAMILHNAGELEEAIATFKLAMRLSPYCSDWFLEELGFTYLDAGRYNEALIALDEYIKRGPTSEHVAHARIARALAYHAKGQYELARAEIAKAKEAVPGSRPNIS